MLSHRNTGLKILSEMSREELKYNTMAISEATYTSWESGQAEPWGEHFYNLAHHFKVPMEVLLDDNFDYELYLMVLKARGTL